MAMLTIRGVPEALVARLQEVATCKGHSIAQEVRELLNERYTERAVVLARIQRRWQDLPPVTAATIDSWILRSRD